MPVPIVRKGQRLSITDEFIHYQVRRSDVISTYILYPEGNIKNITRQKVGGDTDMVDMPYRAAEAKNAFDVIKAGVKDHQREWPSWVKKLSYKLD